ncbi:MAG: CotH kinase family protein [Oligoflexia bacterium]|nr:CotH kinase family protein [Oligoflexia bacterium]
MLKNIFIIVVFFFLQPIFAADVPNQIHIEIKNKDSGYVTLKQRYDFDTPRVKFNEGEWTEAKLHTRGEHCVRPARKCLGFSTDTHIAMRAPYGKMISGKAFILTSLTSDNGYINTKVGSLFLEELKLFHSTTLYVELFINKKSQGLYLLMENPEKALIKATNTPFIARRGFKHVIEVKYYNKKQKTHTQEEFVQAYEEIYSNLKTYKGEDLYNFLKQKMNIDHYMQWLALNYYLKNGDFTDELFIFAVPNPDGSDKIYFDIAGWDFEDLFLSSHLSIQNIWNSELIKSSLVYSVEDSIDKKIAKDDVLNQKFRNILFNLLTTEITDNSTVVNYKMVREEISPYLDVQRILDASVLDKPKVGVYTKNYILDLIDQRIRELSKRRVKTLKKLEYYSHK